MNNTEQENKGIWIEGLQSFIGDDQWFSEAAAEIVDEFCLDLQKEEGMTRAVTEEDSYDEIDNVALVYTHKAQRLIENEIAVWQEIGHKYWPDGDIDIQMHLTQYRELD